VRGRVPVSIRDGKNVAASIVDIERRVAETVRNLRSAAIDVVVIHNVIAIGVDCRDQATVDIILVAGNFHAPGIGDIRQEMLVVIAEPRLVSTDIRYRNKIFEC
jgi:hypothetical protein